MNQTVESKQLEQFETLIEALTPLTYKLGRKFEFISKHALNKRTGGIFRRCVWMQIGFPRPGMMSQATGDSGSNRQSAVSDIILAVLYNGTDQDIERKIVPSDGKQIKAIIDDASQWVSGVNNITINSTQYRQISAKSNTFAMMINLSIDTSETLT